MAAENKWVRIKHLAVYQPESEDEAVIFNPQSGETHLINLLALDVIEYLQQPATLTILTKYIYDLYQIDNEEELNAQLLPLIGQLADLGLIFSTCE